MIRLSGEALAKILDGDARGPVLPPSAVTLGAFDGVHVGHQRLIASVHDARARLGLEAAAVVTFVQSPREVLHGRQDPYQLTTWRAKLAALREAGCEVLVAADFGPDLARRSYREFVAAVLVGHLGMRHFVAGHDVHLGQGRAGNAETLRALGEELGYTMEVCDAVRLDGEIVSSSRIRAQVAAGEVTAAARLLGRPYSLWGVVEPGESRGHAIGYPTANIVSLEESKLLPDTGVYAVRVQVPGDAAPAGAPGVVARRRDGLPEVDRDGNLIGLAPADWAVYDGMLNHGHVPTFHGRGLPEARTEAHLFGFAGELQGRTVKVEWVARLRSERRFAGTDELVAQLARDAAAARAALARTPA